MRRYYGLAVAALVLGCTDDASRTTAPRLSGAVVGGSMAGHDASGSVNNVDNGGRRLTVTLLKGENEVPPRATAASGQLSLGTNWHRFSWCAPAMAATRASTAAPAATS